MGLNEDVNQMLEWLTEDQVTDIILWRMAFEEEQWRREDLLQQRSL